MKISETVSEEMQRRQLIWYGYVRRNEENRMVMPYQPTWKKKRGRARRTWLDRVREAVEERGIAKQWSLDRRK